MIKKLLIFASLISVFFLIYGDIIRAMEVTITFITAFEWLSKDN